MLSKKVCAVIAVLLISHGAAVAVHGQTATGGVMCDCRSLGKVSKPLGDWADCTEACNEKRSAKPPPDTRASDEARTREAEATAREEAAAAERDRIAEEKRLKAIADQRAFEETRDQAVKTLKGSTGTTIHANSPDGSELRGSGTGEASGAELRGSRIDTGLRTGKPELADRDFSGPHAAWKELFCSASILNSAIGTLNLQGENSVKADYSGFKNLAAEATNALNGQVRGVPCATAPEFPTLSSQLSDQSRMIETGKRVLAKAILLAEKLENARAQIEEAKQQLNKPPAAGQPAVKNDDVIARQREINEMRAREAEDIKKATIRFNTGTRNETEAKTELAKIEKAVEKAKDDPKNYGVVFDEVAPPPPPPAVAPKPVGRSHRP